MTNAILDRIREDTRVKRMRMGQSVGDLVFLRSNPEIRMAIVPLLERESERAWTEAAMLDVPDNVYGTEVRDRWLRVNTLWYSLRLPSDLDQKVFASAEELADNLTDIDINYLMEQYQALVDYSSPAVDGITDDQLGELKKALKAIDLSVLSGKPWWHLKAFFMTLTVEQLPARSPSPSSILNLIGMSDETESTPGA